MQANSFSMMQTQGGKTVLKFSETVPKFAVPLTHNT